MLRKLLIVPWFGARPKWWLSYRHQRRRLHAAGYDLLFDNDEQGFRNRVQTLLGVECPPLDGNGKIHDYRPAFGILYAHELGPYDFWGHTDMDCVYGNVSGFMPDERLAELDVYSDHTHYLCGPWALYRKNRTTADTFMDCPDWRSQLEEPKASGWVETDWTSAVNASGLGVCYELNHGYEHADQLATVGERLYEDGTEISFFHFRHTKAWPTVKREALCPA